MENIIQVDSFKLAGIKVRTTNKSGKAQKDINDLWGRFFSEKIQEKIKFKLNDNIYSVYTDYETDHSGEYTAFIGCSVSSFEKLPDGLSGIQINGGTYRGYIATGKLPEAVIKTWTEIWRQDDELNRAYVADFEVYDFNSKDPDNPEVEIYLSVK